MVAEYDKPKLSSRGFRDPCEADLIEMVDAVVVRLEPALAAAHQSFVSKIYEFEILGIS